MKINILLFTTLCLIKVCGMAQEQKTNSNIKSIAARKINIGTNPYVMYFERAYKSYPEIPKGLLEGVALTNTSFNHETHLSDEPENETGLPNVYGVMGLMLNGAGIFRNNLRTISRLSGYTIEEIKAKPEINILAYAKAYVQIKKELKIESNDIEKQIPVLLELSELPSLKGNDYDDYSMNYFLYNTLCVMANADNQKTFNWPNYQIDFLKIFGEKNYKMLTKSEGN